MFFPLTFLMDLNMNLMSGLYYNCERREHHSFIMHLEYQRITRVFLIPTLSQTPRIYIYIYIYIYFKDFSVSYVCNFVNFNVYCISACWYYFYIYEFIALLIWALSIPLFQIHFLHIWLIIIIF